jgi:hypothetical protein
MNKTNLAIVLIFVFLAFILVPNCLGVVKKGVKAKMSTTAVSEKELREKLEGVYNQFLKAAKNKDYEMVSNLLESAKPGPPLPPKEMMTGDTWESIGLVFEDLSKTRFIAVKMSGDWAGYYMEAYLDDPNYVTIDVIKFHLVNKKWKVSGKRYDSSIERKSSNEENRKRILKAIDTDPNFKLP